MHRPTDTRLTPLREAIGSSPSVACPVCRGRVPLSGDFVRHGEDRSRTLWCPHCGIESYLVAPGTRAHNEGRGTVSGPEG